MHGLYRYVQELLITYINYYELLKCGSYRLLTCFARTCQLYAHYLKWREIQLAMHHGEGSLIDLE